MNVNEGCYYKTIQPMGGTQSNLLTGNSPHIEDIALVHDLRVLAARLFVDEMPLITSWWCGEYGRDVSKNDVIMQPMEAHNIH